MRYFAWIGFLLLVSSPAAAMEPQLSPAAWQVNDARPAAAGAFVTYMGRPSLHLHHGVAFLRGVRFKNGVIDADVVASPKGFAYGLMFRVQSAKRYEVVYFRAYKSGTREAVQYSPGLKGAIIWQLLNGAHYKAKAKLSRERWMHVKLAFSGAEAKLYLDGAEKPVMTVPDLKLGDAAGSVGFWALFGGGYVANFHYTVGPAGGPAWPKPNFAPGTIVDWSLSPAFDVKDRSPLHYPAAIPHWTPVKAEADGYVLINRYRASPEIMPTPSRKVMEGEDPASRVVFAKANLHAERAGVRKLAFVYSDEAVVYLNGVPVFQGKNAWRYREYGKAQGVLEWNDDYLYLPLKKGDNELLVATTEYMGGWAVGARLLPSPS